MNKRFAIIDIETTGGSARLDKITEIAIVLHDGKQVLDTWQQLIHPERSIPPYITQITGIHDEMVRHAPKFYEIAREIIEWTEDCVFVAHNVRFDYGFICAEFNQLGYSYSRAKLCTVQMARKAFPGLPSYSLGKLVKHFQINLKNHHRAMDDAMATAELFSMITQSPYYTKVKPILSQGSIKQQKLPSHLDPSYVDSIPNTFGLYYFHDEKGAVIYIGKSIHLRKRIYEHFSDHKERGARLQAAVHSISYKVCNNELEALLLESFEIKRYKPIFNKIQKKKNIPFAICMTNETKSPQNLPFKTKLSSALIESDTVLMYCKTEKTAKSILEAHLAQAGICTCIIKNTPTDLCLSHKLGACAALENMELPWEEKIACAKDTLSRGFDKDGLYVLSQDGEDQHFAILIQHLKFYGMGFLSFNQDYHDVQEIMEALTIYPHHPELPGIIKQFARTSGILRFVPIEGSEMEHEH